MSVLVFEPQVGARYRFFITNAKKHEVFEATLVAQIPAKLKPKLEDLSKFELQDTEPEKLVHILRSYPVERMVFKKRDGSTFIIQNKKTRDITVVRI